MHTVPMRPVTVIGRRFPLVLSSLANSSY
jgi:hypothetical protein